jgi:4-aminobutyrate aminotransferase-like enzyme
MVVMDRFGSSRVSHNTFFSLSLSRMLLVPIITHHHLHNPSIHPFLHRRYPLTIEKGDGCKLYTTDGKEYLDFVAGIATCALGHANASLNAAIAKQMAAVHHVSNLYLIPAQAGLATWLTDNSIADKVFFCNSGAEANEAAIKCARRHASNRGITKPIIITAHQSFHGRTLAALSATGQPKYHKGFGYDGQMVPGFKYVTYNNVDELKAAVKEVQATEGQGLAAVRVFVYCVCVLSWFCFVRWVVGGGGWLILLQSIPKPLLRTLIVSHYRLVCVWCLLVRS